MTKKLIVFQKKNGGNLCTGIKTKKKKSKRYSEENTICSADLMHAKQNSVT